MKITLRVLPLLASLLSACGGGGMAGAPADPVPVPAGPNPDGRDRPNILFLITEDQGAQLGAYGTPGVSTPNEDALAAAGTLYSRAWVTLATCTGSKSSAYTGLYPHTSGATDNVNEFIGSYEELKARNPPWFRDPTSPYNRFAIQARFPTLVEVLRQNGYYTGLQNKFHMAPHWKFPFDLWYLDAQPGTTHYSQVRNFIDHAHASGKTWFLAHVINESHRPYPATAPDIDTRAIAPPAHLPDTPTVRADWATYLEGLRTADQLVGQVMQALVDSGEIDRTLVVFWGDHGPSYHRGKFSSYNLGLQIPLVFRGPGIRPGQVRSELFNVVDFVPTLLDLVVLPQPALQQGVSHAGELAGVTPPSPPPSLVGETKSDRSITDGRWHLLFFPNAADTVMPEDNKQADPWGNDIYQYLVDNKDQPGFAPYYRLLDLADSGLLLFDRPRFELYDLQADPWEVQDLAGDPAQAANLERMKGLLRTWQSRVADPGPAP